MACTRVNFIAWNLPLCDSAERLKASRIILRVIKSTKAAKITNQIRVQKSSSSKKKTKLRDYSRKKIFVNIITHHTYFQLVEKINYSWRHSKESESSHIALKIAKYVNILLCSISSPQRAISFSVVYNIFSVSFSCSLSAIRRIYTSSSSSSSASQVGAHTFTRGQNINRGEKSKIKKNAEKIRRWLKAARLEPLDTVVMHLKTRSEEEQKADFNHRLHTSKMSEERKEYRKSQRQSTACPSWLSLDQGEGHRRSPPSLAADALMLYVVYMQFSRSLLYAPLG